MKKRLMTMLMAVMMLIVLSACGKKTDAIVGVWNADSMEMQGMSVKLEEYAEQTGQDITMTMEYKEDNTVTMDVLGSTGEGTWEAKDGKYTVTIDGDAQEVTVENDELIIEAENLGKVVFKKAAK